MRAIQLIKKAEAAEKRRQAAESNMNMASKEREGHLNEALVVANSVSQCISIYKLSTHKERQITAWTKAVMLLGTKAKNFEDALLIVAIDFGRRRTGKENETWWHWEEKKKLILAAPLNPEQLLQMFMVGNESDERFAEKQLEKLLTQCADLEQLEALRGAFQGKRGKYNGYGGWKHLWSPSAYDRALKRLKPEDETTETEVGGVRYVTIPHP